MNKKEYFDNSSYDMYRSSSFEKMDYHEQLKLKQTNLEKMFAPFKVKVNPILENPVPKNYRHKVILAATNIKQNNTFQLRLGLFVEGSKQIKPKIFHHIHDKEINDLLQSIEKVLITHKIRAYSKQEPRGLIKHVLVRKSLSTKKFMVVLVTQSTLLPNHKIIVKDILAKNKNVETIIQNIQDRETPVVLGNKDRILYGNGYITDQIEDIKFRIHYQSFYQVNPYQMIHLYQYALNKANLSHKDTVVDCYSGIGTISLLAAKKAKSVVGIEVNKKAVEDANYNKTLNNIQNVTFICDDVEKRLEQIEDIDCLIMDPTRDGSSLSFLETVKKRRPKRIVYISCDPYTQIRDLKSLIDEYKITDIQPVDMFSFTAHVENIVLLSLK
ncbi:MAG: 23S rRNA (uracil(1939)-C(5))-methyltransferase RlmD [Candidatus Phytoplasma sp.]|nr:23S rRNA (uracil(1939)-C(5))-methyltransferase RlmD [Phytoplasma sp.]